MSAQFAAVDTASPERLMHVFPTGALVLALLVTACGGDKSGSQTSPTPLASANITPTIEVPPVWTGCPLPVGVTAGTCQLSLSIQNTGAGCASGTVIKVRFLDAGDVQLGGPDTLMDAGGKLSSMIIRPNEIVTVTSVTGIDSDVYTKQRKMVVIPFWHNVACS